MCDITRSNFQQRLPEILNYIERASWLAFDCEYTALRPGETESSLSDTPEARHQKHVDATISSSALVCQFGLAIFVEETADPTVGDSLPDGPRFTAHVYNFFLCPRQVGPLGDTTFVCQASSLEFLGRHGFDFQQWLGDGLGYLSLAQEAELRQLAGQEALFAALTRVLLHEDAEKLHQFCSQVK